MKKTWVRKKVYVSRAIQGRLLLQLSLYWIIYHMILWHVLFLSESLFGYGGKLTFTELYARFCADSFWQVACILAIFPVIFWDMMKMTHRVAGPLVRFEQALRGMMRGERVAPITLRKHDMLNEFRDVFNEFIEYRNRELASRDLEGEPSLAPGDTQGKQGTTPLLDSLGQGCATSVHHDSLS